MTKLIAIIILILSGVGTAVYVGPPGNWDDSQQQQHNGGGGVVGAPEMDPSSAIAALTLLLGGVTVLRSRVSKR